MTNPTIRDIERQANIQAGVESPGDATAAAANGVPMDLSYASIAAALANRYDSIYYVDLRNNHYVEYSSSPTFQELKVEISGDDFFGDSARNIRRIVHPDDQAFALMMHQKGYLLAELEKSGILKLDTDEQKNLLVRII